MSNNYVPVTPSDSTPLATPCGMLYVGVAGDVALIGGSDTSAVTFKALTVGWHAFPFPVTRVMATGTTATNLIASPITPGFPAFT